MAWLEPPLAKAGILVAGLDVSNALGQGEDDMSKDFDSFIPWTPIRRVSIK